MSKPFISIGLPTYNCGHFIKFAVDSVLNQSYNNFELIITDDGSTDDTLKILHSYTDNRIRIYSDGENRGISYRLNQQILLAKGEYFFRMDGDDIMIPNRVELQVNYLLNHPDIDVCGTNALIIDNSNNVIGYRNSVPKHSIKEMFSCHGAFFIHPTVCGKLSYFKQFLYDEKWCGMEDFDLWLRSIDTASFGYIDKALLYYRDPIKFKLRTYLYRYKKVRLYLFSLYKSRKIRFLFYMSNILKIWLKTIISIVLYYLGLSRFLTRRRNEELDSDLKVRSQQMIDKIILNRV